MKRERTKTTIGILLIITAVLLTSTEAYTSLKEILWYVTGSVGIAALGIIAIIFSFGIVLVRGGVSTQDFGLNLPCSDCK